MKGKNLQKENTHIHPYSKKLIINKINTEYKRLT